MVELLILQHPLEVHQAKGSARLLQMSLQRSRLIVGESFDPQVLEALVRGDGQVHNVLLYPDDIDSKAPPPSMEAGPGLCTDPRAVRLWVLDGTWRKSRKMLHLNPALGRMARLALQAPPPSNYLIRKAHRPEQLSTLEACCLALSQLEVNPERYTPLLKAFDGFVASRLGRSRKE